MSPADLGALLARLPLAAAMAARAAVEDGALAHHEPAIPEDDRTECLGVYHARRARRVEMRAAGFLRGRPVRRVAADLLWWTTRVGACDGIEGEFCEPAAWWHPLTERSDR